MYHKYQTEPQIINTNEGRTIITCPSCGRFNIPEQEFECERCGKEIELIAGVETQRDEEVTVEQLEGEIRQIRDMRELLSRLETRVALPVQVGSLRGLNEDLRAVQLSINHTIDKMEDE